MAKQYAPKTFLRQVCASLVNQITRRVGVDVHLGVELLKNNAIDESFDKLRALPADKRKQIEEAFAEITTLATPAGSEILLSESERLKLDISKVLESARNDYERSAWMYLHHPKVFDFASAIHEVQNASAGRWCRRFVGKDLTVRTEVEAHDRLRTMMQQSFRREGRGHRCNIDYLPREAPERHLFIAYPEDHPATELSYDEEGNLGIRSRRSVFEVVFLYRPDEGVLEVLAPGGEKRAEDLMSCFTAAIFGMEDLSPQRLSREHDLAILKSRKPTLSTLPDDGIERVILREVILGLPTESAWRRQVKLTADLNSYTGPSIYQEILETFNADRIGIEAVKVISARFTIIFNSEDGRRGKRLTFVITAPNRCSLRDSRHEQIAKRCIRRWGLCIDGSPAPVISGFRSSWQSDLQLGRHPVLAGPELQRP